VFRDFQFRERILFSLAPSASWRFKSFLGLGLTYAQIEQISQIHPTAKRWTKIRGRSPASEICEKDWAAVFLLAKRPRLGLKKSV
jgi:hypothetical protein